MEALAIACCAPLGAPVLSEEETEATAGLFRALGEPAHVRIMNVLATSAGPVCICNLVEPLGLSQPTVSHHMKKLLEVGLRRPGAAWEVGLFHAEAERLARKLASRGRPEGSVLLMTTTSADNLREEVRKRYAARSGRGPTPEAVAAESDGGCCGNVACDGDAGTFGRNAVPRRRSAVSFRARRRSRRSAAETRPRLREFRDGETVLDLGSGGGIDVLLSATPCRRERHSRTGST